MCFVVGLDLSDYVADSHTASGPQAPSVDSTILHGAIEVPSSLEWLTSLKHLIMSGIGIG